jgi:hypothetical protein
MSIRNEGRRWFIDALDADGGIAFASFRRVDEGDDDVFGEENAVVMAAPHFHPSPVSNRALSLGAINRAAQSGVYVDGREVSFDSLDQLVEFVRKVYVGGGANGSAPNPETPPVPPEGPRGDGPPGVERPEDPEEMYEASRAIIDWLTYEADASRLLRAPHPPYDDRLAYGGRQLIARTAVSIGCSLLERMPYRNDPMEFQWRWFTTTDHLHQLLGCVDMSVFGMDSSMRQKLASAGNRLISDQRRWISPPEPRSEPVESVNLLAWATYKLVIHGEVVAPFDRLDVPHRYRQHPYDGYGVPHDAFSTLAALPIPGDVERPDGLGEDSSIADFLAHCCATSTIMANSHTGTGLLVFAAFCLVAPARIHHFATIGGFAPVLFQVAYRDAMQWLSKQFSNKLPHEMRHMVIGDR